MELNVVAVYSKQVLLDDRNVVNNWLKHDSKLLHVPEVGFFAVKTNKVLTFKQGPAGLDRIEWTAVGRLKLGTEILV